METEDVVIARGLELAYLPDGTLPDGIYVRLDQGTWSYVSPESPWNTQVDTTPYDDGNHTIWEKAVYGRMSITTT